MLFDIFRHQFRKSTTCDISSDDILPNEKKSSSSMKKIRNNNRSRRFSLVKFKSHETKGLKKKKHIFNFK